MSENFLIQLALILIFGIVAQIIAWRLRLPSILLLLIFGFIAGPLTGWVKPDQVFGDLLFPWVSLSVGVILYEGGLNLRIRELRAMGGTVLRLVSIGILVTLVFCTFSAYWILKMDFNLSLLFGSILVVTGPTVIMPLLRQIQPSEKINTVLKWEGMVNDPIGALLAVLVFEGILASGFGEITQIALGGFFKTIVFATVIALVGAWIMVWLLKHDLVPDFLQNPVSLMLVFGVFALANSIQKESGLFSVTLMGFFLANQKKVQVHHIIEFKENLRVLLISVLFIVLAARIELSSLKAINFGTFLFLGILVFIIRPAAVFASTITSPMKMREKMFLAGMAPRGIVAAAVASLFSLELTGAGYSGAEILVPITFFIILGTIAAYGLTAAPLAKLLQIANPNPQGMLILGAQPFARALGKALQERDFKVLLVDTNYNNISKARMEGLKTYHGSILAEYILEDLNLAGIGRLLAVTPNHEVNSLATLYFSKLFGSTQVFQVGIDDNRAGEKLSPELRGKFLFGAEATCSYLNKQISEGASIRSTRFSENFTFEQYKDQFGGADNVLPLFLISENKQISVFTENNQPTPKPGQILISMVSPAGMKRLNKNGETLQVEEIKS
ncbi:MAG: sodium:proton antiporter [Calditrichia bacterium]